MKNIFSTFLILVLMLGILAACRSAAPEPVTITEENAGETIELKKGDTLIIALDGNITTGFNWIPAPQDPVLLEQVGDVEVTPISDAIGAPGKIVLQFTAIAEGQAILHLDYRRSWEDVAPEKTFEVTIVVK